MIHLIIEDHSVILLVYIGLFFLESYELIGLLRVNEATTHNTTTASINNTSAKSLVDIYRIRKAICEVKELSNRINDKYLTLLLCNLLLVCFPSICHECNISIYSSFHRPATFVTSL